MGKLSRTKGAAYERTVAGELHLETGVLFKRQLEQYREGAYSDLVPQDCLKWPFSIECKHQTRKNLPAWQRQAVEAAERENRIPCVIYRITGTQGHVVCLPWRTITAATGHVAPDGWFETDIAGLAYWAREIMASTPERIAYQVPFRGVVT